MGASKPAAVDGKQVYLLFFFTGGKILYIL